MSVKCAPFLQLQLMYIYILYVLREGAIYVLITLYVHEMHILCLWRTLILSQLGVTSHL